MITLEQCLRELASLTQEALTKVLPNGQKFSCRTCPVAVYLHRRTGDCTLSVGVTMVNDHTCQLPRNVTVWIQDFDLGKYPEKII